MRYLKICFFIALGIFIFPPLADAQNTGRCSCKSPEKNVYIHERNIFSNGTEIIVKIHDRFIEVPYLHNANDGKGFFIGQEYVKTNNWKYLNKGVKRTWNCWCGLEFQSEEQLKEHHWRAAHGYGFPR